MFAELKKYIRSVGIGPCYRFLKPDFTEVRGEQVLLVWGQIPYWVVLDTEMREFLEQFDGKTGLHSIVNTPQHRAHKKDILQAVKVLHTAGVLADNDIPHKEEPITAPIENITINITRNCNLSCTFCYNGSRRSTADISADEINSFLDVVRPMCSARPSFIILGGEPLLRPQDVIKTAEHAARLSFSTQVSTNGMLITKEFASDAARIGLKVQVSLDGPDAESHDTYRGEGSFEAARKGAQILIKTGVHTTLSMVCHENNLHMLKEYFQFAHSQNAHSARFIPLKLIGAAKDAELLPALLSKITEQAYGMFKEHPKLQYLAGQDSLSILASTCTASAPRYSCGTGRQTVFLDADGSIYPCPNLDSKNYCAGNIREKDFDFKKLWTDSEILNTIRKETKITAMNAACSRCAFRHWCLGGCRGETLAATGSITAPSPHCSDLKKTYAQIFWYLSDGLRIEKSGISAC